MLDGFTSTNQISVQVLKHSKSCAMSFQVECVDGEEEIGSRIHEGHEGTCFIGDHENDVTQIQFGVFSNPGWPGKREEGSGNEAERTTLSDAMVRMQF